MKFMPNNSGSVGFSTMVGLMAASSAILALASITPTTGATLDGNALARTGAVTLDGNTVNMPAAVTAVGNGPALQKFTLSQNYPNPFNPSTEIQYSLENAAQVSLKVYNLLGQEVATLVNDRQDAGSYTVPFNTNKGARSLSSGVYFYRLTTGSVVSMKKLILMK